MALFLKADDDVVDVDDVVVEVGRMVDWLLTGGAVVGTGVFGLGSVENEELLVLDGTVIVGAGCMLVVVVDPPSMGTVTTGISATPEQSPSYAEISDAA